MPNKNTARPENVGGTLFGDPLKSGMSPPLRKTVVLPPAETEVRSHDTITELCTFSRDRIRAVQYSCGHTSGAV